jgi:uracil-DNA glycosylase
MRQSLDGLCRSIRACRICLEEPRGRPLGHEPRPVLQVSTRARILVAGQAPGTRVHASGRAFTDPSGDRLRAWLGVGLATFYDPHLFALAPMGFCFPGQDRNGADLPPRRECAPAWRSRLIAELSSIELVICLGHYAQRWHMKDLAQRTLHETVLNWREGLALSPPVIAMPHPSWRNNAWLKRNPWFASELLPELRRRVRELAASCSVGQEQLIGT